MNENNALAFTAPDVLEAQLAAWGAAQALSPERAAQWHTAILALAGVASAPETEYVGPLSADWWAALAQDLCATLAMAVAPRPVPVLPAPALP